MSPMSLGAALWILWIGWIVQALWCVCNIWLYPRRMASESAGRLDTPDSPHFRTLVIIPVKGAREDSRLFYHRILNQDYPDYRVIFCFECDTDPAAIALREFLGLGPEETHCRPNSDTSPGLHCVDLVCAGHATDTGQKIHNQIAAMKGIQAEDQRIVFADADMRGGAGWLSRLTAPINLDNKHSVGTYRWLIPEEPTLPNLTVCVMNASVATLGGRHRPTLLWGGSMALSREAFDKIDVPNLFQGSLNDDLHLSRVVRRAGYRPVYLRAALVLSPENMGWGSVIEFVRRQYYQVRHYTPKFYTCALLSTGLYMAGLFTSLGAVLTGTRGAWIPLIAVCLVLDPLRALGRTRIVSRLFGKEDRAQIRSTFVLEFLATPFWMTLHGVLALSALFMTKITWSGITYRVFDRKKIEIVSRSVR